MSFRFSHDARKFFDRIGVNSSNQRGKSTSGQFQTRLDPYWLCCQLGIVKWIETGGNLGFMKSESPEPELVQRFAGPIKAHRDLISGVGFYLHCANKGWDTNKDLVLSEMDKFFSEIPGELGGAGYDLMNGFANGGFEIIYENLGDHTEELSEFLIAYVELLGISDE